MMRIKDHGDKNNPKLSFGYCGTVIIGFMPSTVVRIKNEIKTTGSGIREFLPSRLTKHGLARCHRNDGSMARG